MSNSNSVEHEINLVENNLSLTKSKSNSLLYEAKSHLKLGNEWQEKGIFSDAVIAYEKAIAIKPDYIEPLYYLCRIYEAEEDYVKATECYRRMIGLRPNNYLGYLKLAKVLATQRKIYGAIAAYVEAIKLKPDLGARVYKDYGDLLVQVNSANPDALAPYQKAAEMKLDWGANFYNKFATLLEKQENLELATTYYLKALSLRSEDPAQYLKVGNIYFKQGLLQKATDNYQKALELNPKLVNVYKRLGDLLKQKHQLDDAIRCYQKALEIKPDYKNAYRGLGNVLMEKGKVSEAQQCFQLARQA